MKLAGVPLLAAGTLAVALAAAPSPALAGDGAASGGAGNDDDTPVSMQRLYNPYTGEHFYTANTQERDALKKIGWRYEGVGWVAPKKSREPVYRLYNPYTSDHHYTRSKAEYDKLGSSGWRQEGVGWYSDYNRSVALFREFNPYEQIGTHNYTRNLGEHDSLVKGGWRSEGIAWYGLATTKADGYQSMSKREQAIFNINRVDNVTSRKSLLGFLVGNGFAKADAEWALDMVGHDWVAGAKANAVSYRDSNPKASEADIVKHLTEFWGYTESEAKAAAKFVLTGKYDDTTISQLVDQYMGR